MRRTSQKAKTIKNNAKRLTQQQVVSVERSSATSEEKSIKVGTGRAASASGQEVVSSMLKEGLNELIQFLSTQPDRILLTLKWAQNDKNFTVKEKCPKDFIHFTLVYFSGVPKQLWVQVLLKFFQEKGRAPQTEEVIRKMDKANGLTGITRYVGFVGRFLMTDHLAKEMHYKPLLTDVIFNRMTASGRWLEVEKDGKVKFDDDGEYQLVDRNDQGTYKSVQHVASGVKVAIPDDYTVTGSGGGRSSPTTIGLRQRSSASERVRITGVPRHPYPDLTFLENVLVSGAR